MASLVEIGWQSTFSERPKELDDIIQKAFIEREKCVFWCGGIDKYPLVSRFIRKANATREHKLSLVSNFSFAGLIEVAINFLVSNLRFKSWMFGARPVAITVSNKELGVLTLNLLMTKIKKAKFYPLKFVKLEIIAPEKFQWLKGLGKDVEFLDILYENQLVNMISITDMRSTKKLKRYIDRYSHPSDQIGKKFRKRSNRRKR